MPLEQSASVLVSCPKEAVKHVPGNLDVMAELAEEG
jgi:hypothetical protein